MAALQIVIAVLAWFAIAPSAAVAMGRAVALADIKEGPEPGPSLVRTGLDPGVLKSTLKPPHVAAARDLPR